MAFRNLDRLAHIAQIAPRKGWAHYAKALQLEHFLPGIVHGPTHESDAVRLRSVLEELGPTFVKFGQLLRVVAAGAMSFSSVSVVANALRLNRVRL